MGSSVVSGRLLRQVGESGTILDANISQTVGLASSSAVASSSVASGVICTLPTFFMWRMEPELLQMTVLAMTGIPLGALFM